jgi:hypothetical protein
MALDFEYLKDHRYMVGGVVLVGAVGLYLVSRHGGSATSASYDGITATNAQLLAQSEQLQASQQAQTAQLTAQQNLATTSANYGLALAQINANTSITNTSTAAAVALSEITANENVNSLSIAANLQAAQDADSVSETGISAQLAGLESNNATSLGLATTTANEQIQIANMTAGVQTSIANDQTTLGLAQTAGAVNIADTASNNAAKTAQQASSNSLIGGIVGAIF